MFNVKQTTKTKTKMLLALALATSVTVGAAACSDDAPVADGGQPDLQLHRTDLAHDLASAADAGGADGASEAALPDQQLSVDAPGTATLKGQVGVASTISCTTQPASDCEGALYIGVVDKPAAPPAAKLLGSATIKAADLGGGKQVAFSISGLPAGKGVYLAAMLAESGVLPQPPLPVSGDIVVAPKALLLTAGTSTASLKLDARWK
jgi:hypothetical protein